MSSPLLLAAATETTRNLPVSPWVVGGGAFVLLLILMYVLLSFGRGRPHT